MVWAWVWTALAIIMGIGEAVTAGFFLLPFAVGAVAAAAVAWISGDESGGAIALQWLVFFVFSFLALFITRGYMKRQDNIAQPTVGANRFRDATAWVLTDIDDIGVEGSVRVDGEEWRAATDGAPITSGQQVRVMEVRGTRLIVEPVDTKEGT